MHKHKEGKKEKGNMDATANNIHSELTFNFIIILVIIIIILVIIIFVLKHGLIRLPTKQREREIELIQPIKQTSKRKKLFRNTV